jgi:hypothetical protein
MLRCEQQSRGGYAVLRNPLLGLLDSEDESTISFETSENIKQSKRRNNPEDVKLNQKSTPSARTAGEYEAIVHLFMLLHRHVYGREV